MIHKPTKDKRDEFENLMIGGIKGMGGSKCDRCGYNWELTTLYGTLVIEIMPSLFGIHAKFQTKPDVDVLGGIRVNPISGQWNTYRYKTDVPRIAATQLIDTLRTLVFGDYLPATANYQPLRRPGGHYRTKQREQNECNE